MNRLVPSGPAPHALERHTVVCITDQFHCEKLIHAGRLIAELSKTALAVVNVSKPDLSQNYAMERCDWSSDVCSSDLDLSQNDS